MLGSAAHFGKPYPVQRDQERFTNDPSCDFGIPGTNHGRAVSGNTISSGNGGIPSAFGISNESSSKGTSTATNNTPPNVKRVQKKMSGSDGSRRRGDFISKRSGNKISKKGYKGKKSDLDDDDDSTEDPSSSEDDDAPNIDHGFAKNTRVFMADGSTKRIKKIQPGEYVLGPDRLPRLVVGADAGYSPMIQVRELSQNIAHLPDDFFGLVTFSCTPEQALRLATAQHQGVHVGHDDKNHLHRVDFRRLKRVQGALIVVGSHENFRDSLPNARQEAEAFTRNRSKDVIYWTLPVDCHHLVSVAVQLQTYHLTAALDFETGRLRYHALKSGFKDEIGMLEKLAYIWGTWIGDGDSTWAKIAVNRKDKEQIARIGEVCFDLGLAAHLYELSEKEKAIGNLGGQVGITSRVHNRRNYFMIFLRRLGLGKSGAKYVPRWLRTESISVREHFLAGLIDSDGHREQQRRPFVSDSNGATPHDRDKSGQCRIYKRAPITTVYPKIAEGVFVLARSLGIPYSVSYRPAWVHGDKARQQGFRIKLQPCSALTNILSLCAVDTKWQSAPLTFARHHIEYRYGTFCQEVVAAVHKLPDLPPELPLNQEETTALVRQLDYPTLALLAKRYQNFGHSHKQVRERLGVSSTITSAYFSNKRNDKKLENFMRAQVSEKLSIEEIRRLVLLTRNPSRHHAVALSLDPATDGLFVLGNNAVVTSREQLFIIELRDWGSSDVLTLHSTVQGLLQDNRKSFIVDRQANNANARKVTILLFFSRLLIFKHCLNVAGSSQTFTSARWTLLQVCPHVLFDKDIFNMLFLQLLNLQLHGEAPLSLLIRNLYEDTKECLIKQGCLPHIKEDTRLLVVHDEAQFLGDEFNGSFQSMSSSDETPRPLLSPILHAFRNIGEHQLTLVTCGTGLSINTLFWVQSSGSGLKDSSTTFDYLEFPGWTDQDSIKAYISRVRNCLKDEKSRQALNEYLSKDALAMLYDKFVGRYRPCIVAIARIIECNDPSAWKRTVEDAEERLVSWAYRHIKGNLCYEILRVHEKQNKYKELRLESIDNMLGLLMYQRCMFGNHDLVLKEVNPQLVEHAFGRIKIIKGHAVTVMDEPFVSLAVQNYFAAIDPYFAREVRKRMVKSSAIEQGCVFERFMMKVFSETFNTRPLSEWPHQPAISEMCPALVGKVEIVGWREPGLEQGTTHAMMSMEEFMKAHVKEGSVRNKMPVAPFFFPKSKPSGPDLLFFIRVDGRKAILVFVQMKLHQGSSNFSERDWSDALSTVSAPKIEDHAKNLRKYCPDHVYVSMIVAYPTKWTEALLAPSEVPKDSSGVQQVVINVSDNNFGDIFPHEHVEFIDQLKNARKRSADNDDSNDEDCSKKSRS
ncbi:H(+)-transporting V1 sector ATPase subunit A [Mortierella alpina]|nr:H(+)-transporting V1 sector ATPase subunit A [Mortierella alpina]